MIIDGNSLMNRAYYGVPPLTNTAGIPTNAVYGFLNMMHRLIDDYQPTHFSVAFDMKGPTFRHKTFKDYKSTRKGMHEDLRIQMPIIKEILDVLKIHRMEIEGFEADDLIGTVAKYFSKNKILAKVVTGDKDALQLTDDYIEILYAKKGQFLPYTCEMIEKEFGGTPSQVIDYKGLAGDASDNIPGIPGFGPKTAIKLLKDFASVEGVIHHVEEISNKRWRNLIYENQEQALLSKKLATIMTEVPVDINEDLFLREQPDLEATVEILKKYNFNKLISRYKTSDMSVTENEHFKEPIVVNYIENDEGFKELDQLIKKHKKFVFNILGEKENVLTDHIYAWIILVNYQYFYISDGQKGISNLKDFFEDPSIEKYSHDTKQAFLKLFRYALKPRNINFDTFVAAYLINPEVKSYELSELLIKNFTETILSEEELLGKGKSKKTYSDIDKIKLGEYGANQCYAIKKLKEFYDQKLEEENLKDLFYDIELPLVEVLASLEFEGVAVDEKTLNDLDEMLSEKIKNLTEKIYEQAGESFNINSPKQLGVILFEKLHLPSIKKTKTGYSTSHDILMKLRHDHDIIEDIMAYRMYAKLKSTYIDGLRQVVNPVSHRIHSSFNQTVAITGRLSSTEPNMQNIPMKIEEGRQIRKIFVSKAHHKLIGADYSQIELRVLAHMSQDETLIHAYEHKIDIHSLTAASVFDVPLDEVTRLQRTRAKEVNFGIVYGMSDYGLSENLNITRKEAKVYIEQYFKKYSKVKTYMEKQVELCKEKGYVTTLLNRKRNIPEINSSNFNVRSFAERTAMNTPIQGSAADIIKIAMVEVYKALNENNFKSKLILQVHDELIVETHEDEIEEIQKLLKEKMEEAVKLSVPLEVDMNIGSSWYETK
jgi:DNA polymerase-1